MKFRFMGCVYAAGCSAAVNLCESPPAQDSPECIGSCDAIFALCGRMGGVTDLETCPPLCTGIFMQFPATNPDAAACIEEYTTCGDAPVNTSFEIVLDCMLLKSEECTSLCAALIPCMPPEEDLTQASCETYCALGGLGDSVAVASCIAGLDPTACMQIFACLESTASDVPPLCDAMCGKLTETCGLPAFACEEGCAAEMTSDTNVSAAGKVCALMADCGALDACQGLDPADVPQACVEACAASPDACGSLPGGCEAACQGIAAALPDALDEMSCIMATSGPSCAVEQLATCF
jgi:hypothetical protein